MLNRDGITSSILTNMCRIESISTKICLNHNSKTKKKDLSNRELYFKFTLMNQKEKVFIMNRWTAVVQRIRMTVTLLHRQQYICLQVRLISYWFFDHLMVIANTVYCCCCCDWQLIHTAGITVFVVFNVVRIIEDQLSVWTRHNARLFI